MQPKEEFTKRAKTNFPSDPRVRDSPRLQPSPGSPRVAEDAIEPHPEEALEGVPTVHRLQGGDDVDDLDMSD